MKDDRYSVRRYAPGDEFDINELFNTVFSQFRPIEEWEHKFSWGEPDERGLRSIVVGCCEDRIVGVQGGIPTLFRFPGGRLQCMHIVDNAILPEHRRSGLQRAMYELLCDFSRERNGFAFGFPGGYNLEAGTKALGWRVRVRLEPWVRSMELPANAELSRSGFAIAFGPPRAVDSVVLSGQTSDRIHIERSDAYMEWRYRNTESTTYYAINCTAQGACVGYLIFGVRRADPHTAMLYEMQFPDDALGTVLLHRSIELLSAIGLQRMNTYLSLESSRVEWIRRMGFTPLSSNPLTMVTSENFMDCIPELALAEPRNWDITLGDSDR